MEELIAEVFDGTALRGTCRVSWEGDRITSVEPVARAAARTKRHYLVPGLVDTHVHLLGHALAEARRVDGFTWPVVTPPEEQSLHVAANAERALRRGVTTMREMSGDGVQVAVRRVFEAGIATGPRLLVAGRVGMTGGHGDLFHPAALAERPPVADSPWECRKLVRTWARAGLDAIKIYASGGVLSLGDAVTWRNNTPEELAATVDEAHALGMRVGCHAHSEQGVQLALECGADSIEHATQLNHDQALTLAERGIPVAPTLLINDLIAAGEKGVTGEATAKATEVLARRDDAFAAAAAAGVDFVLGTDASGYIVHHGQQADELLAMARVFAWTPIRTLQAATSRAAAAIGWGDKAGRIVPGFYADFVLCDAAPWEDLAVLNGPLDVYCRGRLV